MKQYEKTANLYERYKDKPDIGKYNNVVTDEAFNLIKAGGWVFTEKIDGMNIRIILSRSKDGQMQHEVKGKTDRAQIPGDLLDNIRTMVTNREAELDMLLPKTDNEGVTLYGEGYGAGIQKGGDYRDTKGFVLFDIARWTQDGDDVQQYYLQHQDVLDVAEGLKIDTAPVLFEGMGLEAVVKQVRTGFPSVLAKSERLAEGVIGVVPGLYRFYQGGLKRLKFKLKTKDFPR